MTHRNPAAEARKILKALKARHPAAFPKPPRPLKIGVREDLLAAGWSEAEVSLALNYYLNTKSYLRATFAQGAFRIDLNGWPTAPVKHHEAEWAKRRRDEVARSEDIARRLFSQWH